MNPLHPALRLPGVSEVFDEAAWRQLPGSPEGVPIAMRHQAEWLEALGADLDCPLDGLTYSSMCHLAHYLPRHAARDEPLGLALAEVLDRYAPAGAELAVDMGCSVGADLPRLRRHAAAVIGVDASIGALRAARLLLDGVELDVPVREEGRRFHWAEDPLCVDPLSTITLVCADALDPPLAAGCARIVLAHNLLDNVSEPVNLIGQLDAILAPGGLLVLASPFQWDDKLTPPEEQLGGGTVPAFQAVGSARAIAMLLRGETPYLPHLDYELLETRDVPWRIRDHARCEVRYLTHLVAARKSGSN